MAKILTTVPTEQVTLWARLVAFLTALFMVLVNLNIMTADQAGAVIDFLNNPRTVSLVNAAGTIIIMALPAIQGWRSRDRELPEGTTTKEVAIKAEAAQAVPEAAKMELGVAPPSPYSEHPI